MDCWFPPLNTAKTQIKGSSPFLFPKGHLMSFPSGGLMGRLVPKLHVAGQRIHYTCCDAHGVSMRQFVLSFACSVYSRVHRPASCCHGSTRSDNNLQINSFCDFFLVHEDILTAAFTNLLNFMMYFRLNFLFSFLTNFLCALNSWFVLGFFIWHSDLGLSVPPATPPHCPRAPPWRPKKPQGRTLRWMW